MRQPAYACAFTNKMATKCWPIALTYNIDRQKKSIIRVRGALFHEFKGTLAHGEMRPNLLDPYVLQFQGIDCSKVYSFIFRFFIYKPTFRLLRGIILICKKHASKLKSKFDHI